MGHSSAGHRLAEAGWRFGFLVVAVPIQHGRALIFGVLLVHCPYVLSKICRDISFGNPAPIVHRECRTTPVAPQMESRSSGTNRGRRTIVVAVRLPGWTRTNRTVLASVGT